MATRSRIGKANADGTVTSVYCHWDGYPSYTGQLLQTCYTDEQVVDKLIANGDLSYLSTKIDPTPDSKHSFDTPEDGVCVYYGRDRKEPNTEPQTSATELEYFSEGIADVDYLYLYKPQDGWILYDGNTAESLPGVLAQLNPED